MGLRIHFVLVAEGTSDHGMVAPLQALLVRAGADEAFGVAPDLSRLPRPPGKGVVEQVSAALELEPSANVVFIHRDSDSRSAAARRSMIAHSMTALQGTRFVPVVPIQETEAWLLVDDANIRLASGNPNGRVGLRLPAVNRIEDTASPKEILAMALLCASELTGRRRRRFVRDFPKQRARLLDSLDIDGPVTRLSAWKQLVADVNGLVADIAASEV